MLAEIPIARERPHLGRSALATRRAVLIPEPSEEMIASLSQSQQHLRALRAAEIRSIVAAPLLAHGNLLGAIALISSHSSRMYGQSDVRLVEELARRAALSLENARLYRSARLAAQARDEILAIVAHDLRNPASTILMQTALLRYGAQPRPGARKPADVIERAATRMLRLIQDLLDETSIEAGRLSIEPTSIAPTQLVSDSLERQKPLTASASLELRPDLQAQLPEVWADRDRLLQVFENLIGNALKFTEPGGQITLGAAPRGTEVLFWVADTGRGIAAEDLPRLFDRFWQAQKRQGAGLGLPIVKGIIEAHHGRIWVESTPGKGTTFCFTIPTASRAKEWRRDPAPASH
jgi:signal transduction histidine kinase